MLNESLLNESLLNESLDFYRTPGPMTGLAAGFPIGDIPTDSDELRLAVQGLLVHRDWAIVYGLEGNDVRLDEQHLRTTKATLGRAFELSDEPIAVERPPVQRVVGICRHYALVQVAFLRSLGTPARVRCGFANYFDPDKWVDHWITEWWNGHRWVREDPQVDDLQAEICQLDFDPYDQPPGRFLDGAQAWTAARAGEVDPQLFGILDMWGLSYIAGNVLHDFICLNKVELLPWDSWGLEFGPYDELTDEILAFVDNAAALALSDETDAIRERYKSDARLTVPSDIVSFIDGTPTEAHLEL